MTSELPAPAPVQLVQTRIGPIAVRRNPESVGAGLEPAVFVHGLGGNSLNWVDLALNLSDRLDCVALDLPGFGATEPPSDGDYSIGAHTRAVVALLEEMFPGQSVHLFGNSMGGAVAVQVAARHPRLVRRLCLISPALPDLRPMPTNVHIPVMSLPGVGSRIFDRYARVGHEERVTATFDMCFADPGRLHPQRRAEAVAEAARRDTLPWIRDAFIGSAQSLVGTFLDRGADRPWALAGRVQAPAFLIYGRRDKLVSSRAARRASRAFPNARVVVLPDAGHVAQMEHPEEVAGLWREWIRS